MRAIAVDSSVCAGVARNATVAGLALIDKRKADSK